MGVTLTQPPTFLVHVDGFGRIDAVDEGGQSDGQSDGNEDENGGEERQPTLEARTALPPRRIPGTTHNFTRSVTTLVSPRQRIVPPKCKLRTRLIGNIIDCPAPGNARQNRSSN